MIIVICIIIKTFVIINALKIYQKSQVKLIDETMGTNELWMSFFSPSNVINVVLKMNIITAAIINIDAWGWKSIKKIHRRIDEWKLKTIMTKNRQSWWWYMKHVFFASFSWIAASNFIFIDYLTMSLINKKMKYFQKSRGFNWITCCNNLYKKRWSV